MIRPTRNMHWTAGLRRVSISDITIPPPVMCIVRSDQMTVTLREVTQEDLPIFFEHQLDAEATRMAAFPSRDRDAFMAHWARIMSNENGILKTILADDTVAGNVDFWEAAGE